jgi:putative ribosome biogenesis GTPase RsgA
MNWKNLRIQYYSQYSREKELHRSEISEFIHQMHIIASIDRVFLLITINNPPTTFNFIDRFLVTAEAYGIETILVFNKIDTFDEATLDEQLYMQHVSGNWIQCLRVSSTEMKGRTVERNDDW